MSSSPRSGGLPHFSRCPFTLATLRRRYGVARMKGSGDPWTAACAAQSPASSPQASHSAPKLHPRDSPLRCCPSAPSSPQSPRLAARLCSRTSPGCPWFGAGPARPAHPHPPWARPPGTLPFLTQRRRGKIFPVAMRRPLLRLLYPVTSSRQRTAAQGGPSRGDVSSGPRQHRPQRARPGGPSL